jgi:hypothetical protein
LQDFSADRHRSLFLPLCGTRGVGGGLLLGWGGVVRGLGDLDGLLDELADLVVAFDGDGDGSAAAGGDLSNVGEGLFVLETLEGSLGSLVAMQTTGKVSSMRAFGPCFISPAG